MLLGLHFSQLVGGFSASTAAPQHPEDEELSACECHGGTSQSRQGEETNQGHFTKHLGKL
jgi:hypothetical protein